MNASLKRLILPIVLCLVLCAGCSALHTQHPEDSFSVHYIDVGQADAALVVCDGHYMLIDGGNAEDSDLIYSYLKKLGVDRLDYMVATHAHEDHIGGLSGALNYATVDTALSPVAQHDTKVFQNMLKYLNQQNCPITIPSPGDTFLLGEAQVEILGPVREYSNTNDTSIVLRVDYGDTSFLFTGDMESQAEQDLIDQGADLSATVLKVGHHGSSSSSGYVFLREVMPQYAVISVGTDNSYKHPSEQVLSRLRDVGSELYRTDMQGTVIARSDGSTVVFETEKNAGAMTNPTAPLAQGFVGNRSTQKFHLPDCSSVQDMKQDNQVSFDSRQQAISSGYSPCQRCNP